MTEMVCIWLVCWGICHSYMWLSNNSIYQNKCSQSSPNKHSQSMWMWPVCVWAEYPSFTWMLSVWSSHRKHMLVNPSSDWNCFQGTGDHFMVRKTYQPLSSICCGPAQLLFLLSSYYTSITPPSISGCGRWPPTTEPSSAWGLLLFRGSLFSPLLPAVYSWETHGSL